MAKHRSHAAKKHVTTSSHGSSSPRSGHILPFTIKNEREKAAPGYLSWPAYLFGLMLNPWRGFTTPIASWITSTGMAFPKTESYETEKAYIYTAELPGISSDEIALTFQNGALMLRVEQSEDRRERGRTFRQSQSVRRSFTLPVYTNAEKITAKLKNGLLTVTIPKSPKQVPPTSHNVEIS